MTSLYEADDLPFRTDVGDANAVRYLAAWLPPTTSGGAFRISNSCAEHAGFPPGVVDIFTGTPHAIGAEARIVIESSRQHYNTERPHDCAALINHGRQAHHALDSTQAHVLGPGHDHRPAARVGGDVPSTPWLCGHYHHRQVVVLRPEDWAAWLYLTNPEAVAVAD